MTLITILVYSASFTALFTLGILCILNLFRDQ